MKRRCLRLLLGSIISVGCCVVESSSQSPELYKVERNGLWGFIDRAGRVQIPPAFEEVSDFVQGYARVKAFNIERNVHGWGFVDPQGKVVIPTVYSDAGDFSHGFAAVATDEEENRTFPSRIHEEIPNEQMVADFVGGHYKYISNDNRSICSSVLRSAGPFENNLAVVGVLLDIGGNDYVQMGVLDNRGGFFVDPTFEEIRRCSIGMFWFEVDEYSPIYSESAGRGKWGLLDKFGKVFVKAKYDEVSDFSEGLAAVSVDGKFGFIDSSGEWVVTPDYDEVKQFTEGLATVRVKDSWGVINHNGKFVIDPADGVAIAIGGNRITVSDWGGQGRFPALVYTRAGKKLNRTHFAYISGFHDGYSAFYVPKTYMWGYMDSNCTVCVKPQFDKADDVTDGMAPVCSKGKWGLIDMRGKVVLAPRFDRIALTKNRLVEIWIDHALGYADRAGHIVWQPRN